MKHNIYILFVLLLFACGNQQQNTSNKVSTDNRKTENPKSTKVMEKAIIEAFCKVPGILISLKECLGDVSDEKRKNLIQSSEENHISFNEPCNGSLSEFAFIPSSKVYFLSVCQGAPGCDQKVYIFDENMKLMENAVDEMAVSGFLKKNPLINNRIKSLNMPGDAEESVIYSVNKETNSIMLIPDPEFTDERVPLGRAKIMDGKLVLSQ